MQIMKKAGKAGLGLMLGLACVLGAVGCQNDGLASPAAEAPAPQSLEPQAAYVVIPGVTSPLKGSCSLFGNVCTEGMKTYVNECAAKAAGAKILFRGHCPRFPRGIK
jgi:hypothetical protein